MAVRAVGVGAGVGVVGWVFWSVFWSVFGQRHVASGCGRTHISINQSAKQWYLFKFIGF
jgi:hypothetical protein